MVSSTVIGGALVTVSLARRSLPQAFDARLLRARPRLCTFGPRFARRSRFVALSLFAAFTAIATTPAPLATSAAFAVFSTARRNGLALVDRRDAWSATAGCSCVTFGSRGGRCFWPSRRPSRARCADRRAPARDRDVAAAAARAAAAVTSDRRAGLRAAGPRGARRADRGGHARRGRDCHGVSRGASARTGAGVGAAGFGRNHPSILSSQLSCFGTSTTRSTGIGAGCAGVMPLTTASWRGSRASSFICRTGSSSIGRSTMSKLAGCGSAWLRSS